MNWCIINDHTGRALRDPDDSESVLLFAQPGDALRHAAAAVQEVKAIAAYSVAVGVCAADTNDPEPSYTVMPLVWANVAYDQL